MFADLKDIERRMEGALTALATEFKGLRAGRASAGLLDSVTVDAYGSTMPLNQVGSVAVPDPRMISVNVWDATLVTAVDKAVRDAGLGLNPVIDGQNLKIPIPPLNEERRRDLAKLAGKYAEQARIAVRNVRRDAMETIKKREKEGEIGEDERHTQSDEVQKLTDTMISRVDESLKNKESEIMQV